MSQNYLQYLELYESIKAIFSLLHYAAPLKIQEFSPQYTVECVTWDYALS